MTARLGVSLVLCAALAGCSAARVVVDSAESFAEGDIVDGLISMASAPVALANDLQNNPFLSQSEDAPESSHDTPYAVASEDPNPIPDSIDDMAALYDPNRNLTVSPPQAESDTDPYSLSTPSTSSSPYSGTNVQDDPYALDATITPPPATVTNVSNAGTADMDPETRQRCASLASDPRRLDGNLPVSDRYFLNSICTAR